MAENLNYTFRIIDKFTEPLKRIRKATDRATKSTKLMQKRVGMLNTDLEKMRSASDKVSTSLLQVAAVGYIFAKPVKSAIEFEAAMADVRKVVDFKAANGLQNMAKDIRNMSKSIPITAVGLSQIVASGGQMGVAEKNLTKFAESSAKMAVAFDITAQEAGEAMGAFANIFRIPIKDIDMVGDAINHLSNSTIARANEITRALQNKSAAAGNAMNLEANETIALASTFIELQVPVDRIGSLMEAMARTFTNTSVVGKKMAAEFREDGRGSLIRYFTKLNELSPDDKSALLVKHFGSFAIKIKQLSNNMPKLLESLRMTSNELEFLGSMQKEYNSRINTTEAKLIMFQNRVQSLSIALGNGFLPVLVGVIALLGGMIAPFDWLATNFPVLTGVVMGSIGALIALRLVTLLVTFAKLQLGIALITFKSMLLATRVGVYAYNASLVAMAGVMKFVRFGMLLMNAAFMANPIGFVIGAVLIFVSVLNILYKKFEPFTNFVNGMIGKARELGIWFGRIFGGSDNKTIEIITSDRGAKDVANSVANNRQTAANMNINGGITVRAEKGTSVTENNIDYSLVGQGAGINGQ